MNIFIVFYSPWCWLFSCNDTRAKQSWIIFNLEIWYRNIVHSSYFENTAYKNLKSKTDQLKFNRTDNLWTFTLFSVYIYFLDRWKCGKVLKRCRTRTSLAPALCSCKWGYVMVFRYTCKASWYGWCETSECSYTLIELSCPIRFLYWNCCAICNIWSCFLKSSFKLTLLVHSTPKLTHYIKVLLYLRL